MLRFSRHYGRNYATFNVTDADSNMYVLGLKDLLTKSGKDTLDTFRDILFDMDTVYYKEGKGDVSQDILYQLRNLMFDRAATEQKFVSCWNNIKEAYYPRVNEN